MGMSNDDWHRMENSPNINEKIKKMAWKKELLKDSAGYQGPITDYENSTGFAHPRQLTGTRFCKASSKPTRQKISAPPLRNICVPLFRQDKSGIYPRTGTRYGKRS